MKKIIILFFMLLSSLTMFSQTTTHYNHDDQLMLEGYDVVAYFTKNKAIEGSKNFQHTHQQLTYYFSSQQHLNLFKANPHKYIPQYGGWCAYAMGDRSDKVNSDPETFKITNGKLYLFYNSFFMSTLDDWNEDPVNLKKQADQHWKVIFK